MGKKERAEVVNEEPTPPKLVKRRENRKSSFKLGRTIGEKREKLETANERQAARKKDKKKKALRVIATILGFLILIAILIVLFKNLTSGSDEPVIPEEEISVDYEPTIEIIDAADSSNKHITARMKRYIGRAEKDFRDLGYQPTKAVIPTNSIREVDFYLEEKTGYIKLTIDRDSAISVEDADRMLRYLIERGIENFEYIDVRIDGKAYYK
ncbi:hypothetical protein J6V85_03450 [Candidatus Saccharibacteria bacterium]|nr:hypothetical protein [Candidatus Saccharibacteria bacterium]